MRRGSFGLLLLAVLAGPAHAGEVSVTLNPTPEGQDFANAVGLTFAELEQQITAEVEEVFAAADTEAWLRALADAAGLSNKGLGVDYASNMKSFTLGASANVAVSLGDNSFGDLENVDQPVGGIAANISIMAGANMGFLGIERLNIYANYFQRSFNLDNLNGFTRNAGLHGRFKLIEPTQQKSKSKYVFQWGGLDITSGLQYSYLSFGLDDTLESNFDVGSGMTQAPVTLTSAGTFDLRLTGIIVPIEVTTSVRMLSVVSLYGGAAADIQFGGAELEAQLNGDFVGVHPVDGNMVNLGTGSLTASDSSGPSIGRFRFFGGLQINVLALRLFVQADLKQDLAAAISFGTRVVY